MALSNNGVTTAQPESGAAIAVKPESPTRSSIAGFTGYSDVAQDVRQGANASQQSDYSSRSSLNLELPQFQQASANEAAKEAATHDFLSRCGNTSSAGQMQTPPVRGLASVTTQDFLQPLEECGKTAGASLLSQGSRSTSVPGNRLRKSGADNHGGSRETSYTILSMKTSKRLENLSYWPNVQLKFGASELGYDTKTTPSHAYLEIGQQYQSSLTKQWQQAGSELIDVAKKPWRAPSEDDEDEDDECPDGSQDQRKNNLSQKGDTSQKLEGKNDVRGSTSRSKHSATEQRRRSKINDRFQMLRQLVPNNDQKRDKASFLLEVIEYIQFLQEKVRKNEAAEHGRQQERLKNMPWDACQMGTTVDAQRLDSLTYGKEHIPVVSTVPFDIMQATDANCVIRPVLTSVAGATDHEVGASDLLANMGHVTMHLDRTVQASQGSHPSYENVSIILKPKTTMTLPIPPAVHRVYGASSAHFFHSGPLPAPAAHVVSRHLSLPEEQVVQAFPKLKSTFHASHSSHLHGSNPPLSQSTVHADDQYHLELKARQSHTFEQEANSGQQSRETFNAIPDSELQLSCTGLSSRQLSNGNIAVSISTSDLHNPIVPQSESLQRVEVQADGQEPLVIHGGVINVSSVYSQGLLDTLARALQSSGLDLSQASISVQIDLGKPGGVAVATNCAEAVNPGVLQESQGPSRHAGGLPELEHVKKKPKVEADS